jgi:hypothetical protein
MKPSKLAKLLYRHTGAYGIRTEHGMYKDAAYLRWRDTPRKWVSLTTWSGQDFVTEDK